MLSFNVDGSVRGNPGEVGIGGVLRAADGKVLCLFSSYVGILAPIAAELLAIHKACELFASNNRFHNQIISFVSDSQSVVSWINGEDFGNLRFVKLIYDIRQLLMSRTNVVAEFTSRKANSLADSLAKAGAYACGERLEWGVG